MITREACWGTRRELSTEDQNQEAIFKRCSETLLNARSEPRLAAI